MVTGKADLQREYGNNRGADPAVLTKSQSTKTFLSLYRWVPVNPNMDNPNSGITPEESQSYLGNANLPA